VKQRLLQVHLRVLGLQLAPQRTRTLSSTHLHLSRFALPCHLMFSRYLKQRLDDSLPRESVQTWTMVIVTYQCGCDQGNFNSLKFVTR
jgi:hypothetical protein